MDNRIEDTKFAINNDEINLDANQSTFEQSNVNCFVLKQCRK